MPELPEVESLRRTLEPVLVGRTVARAELRRPDVCTTAAAPATPADLLEGARVTHLDRRGKQLTLHAGTGRLLLIHLGMTGQVLHHSTPIDSLPTHTHARWRLDDGSELLFRDPRRFGGLWPLESPQTLHDRHWAALGPDALAVTPEHLLAHAKPSRRALKAILLDQAVLAGVGNIYADEALFRASLRPTRPGATLHPHEAGALAHAIREVLADAIASGGSTLRDYANARGEPGSFQSRHAVYGRAGLPCPRCQSPLRGVRLSQRATVYCPQCQPSRAAKRAPAGLSTTYPHPHLATNEHMFTPMSHPSLGGRRASEEKREISPPSSVKTPTGMWGNHQEIHANP